MPMLRISVQDNLPRIHGSTAPILPTLRHCFAQDPGPIKVMIHGFKYLPGHPSFCPHDGILSRNPLGKTSRMVSWPRHLGLRGQPGEGLGMSFGWGARGSIRTAYQAAESAGDALAKLLTQVHDLAPERPIQLIAHSLGARVALRAISKSPAEAVSHAVLMAAAEYQSVAEIALSGCSGKTTQILNVSSRENDLFDFLLERLVTPPVCKDRMMGHGSLRLANMATLQLDDPKSLTALSTANFPIARPQRRVCHWSPYLRPGVFPLYRAFLNNDMSVGQLRALLPSEPQPRWSRLLQFGWRSKSDHSALNLG